MPGQSTWAPSLREAPQSPGGPPQHRTLAQDRPPPWLATWTLLPLFFFLTPKTKFLPLVGKHDRPKKDRPNPLPHSWKLRLGAVGGIGRWRARAWGRWALTEGSFQGQRGKGSCSLTLCPVPPPKPLQTPSLRKTADGSPHIPSSAGNQPPQGRSASPTSVPPLGQEGTAACVSSNVEVRTPSPPTVSPTGGRRRAPGAGCGVGVRGQGRGRGARAGAGGGQLHSALETGAGAGMGGGPRRGAGRGLCRGRGSRRAAHFRRTRGWGRMEAARRPRQGLRRRRPSSGGG